MTSNSAFVGVHLSYGRKPVTVAFLDDDLDLIMHANCDMEEAGALLSEPDSVTVCVTGNASSRNAKFAALISTFYAQLEKMSFRSYPTKNETRQWFKANADELFATFLKKKLLSRRTLEGRIQRALILYDHGLQIKDPMEFFEEITRYKLIQGILPLETLYSAKELDALMAGYVAWLTVNRPEQSEMLLDNMVLPEEQVEE